MAGHDLAEVMEAYRRKWEEHRTRAAGYKTPAYKCAHCKDMGFIDLYPPNPCKPAEGKISTVMYCPYCRAGTLRDISGIIAEYRELDIAKFPWGTYKKDMLKLRRTVESFVYDFRQWQDEGVGLYIYSGEKGSGKTMVANAICGSICTKYNIAVRFTKFEDFYEDVKKTWGGKNSDWVLRADVRKYYDTDLLVIDDLGVTKISESGKDALHDLVNERYKAGRLCIITSNFVMAELPVHAATADRINDMCLTLHWPEEPVRSMKAEERKDRLLQHVDSYDRLVDAPDSPFGKGGQNETR